MLSKCKGDRIVSKLLMLLCENHTKESFVVTVVRPGDHEHPNHYDNMWRRSSDNIRSLQSRADFGRMRTQESSCDHYNTSNTDNCETNYDTCIIYACPGE
jgi:hypothetical protein